MTGMPPELTEQERLQRLMSTKRRLRAVAAAIARAEALYDERTDLFRELVAQGLTHEAIGEIAGVRGMTVSKALRKEAANAQP